MICGRQLVGELVDADLERRPRHPVDVARGAIGKSAASVAIHSRLIVNTAEAAIDAAIAGLCVTRLLSYQIVSVVRASTLTIILEAFEPPSWSVSLIYASGRLLPIKLRAFLDFAASRLRARLAEGKA